MINFITALLLKAYNIEARKFHRKAQALEKAAEAKRKQAEHLAKKADETIEESREYRRESMHSVDRAAHFAAKGESVKEFFLGETK